MLEEFIAHLGLTDALKFMNAYEKVISFEEIKLKLNDRYAKSNQLGLSMSAPFC